METMLKALIGAFNIVSVKLTICFYAQLVTEALQIFVFSCKVPNRIEKRDNVFWQQQYIFTLKLSRCLLKFIKPSHFEDELSLL